MRGTEVSLSVSTTSALFAGEVQREFSAVLARDRPTNSPPNGHDGAESRPRLSQKELAAELCVRP
jgi:hypothetical protein